MFIHKIRLVYMNQLRSIQEELPQIAQFNFLKEEFPQIHEIANSAAVFVHIDYRTACLHARIALELIFKFVYERNVHSRDQKTLGQLCEYLKSQEIIELLTYTQAGFIIVNGNNAAHEKKVITVNHAIKSARSLYNITYSFVYKYGSNSLPKTQPDFDPDALPKILLIPKQTIAKYKQSIGSIIFIENLDDQKHLLWFQSSKKVYEEVFFPNPSDRLPFEEIEKRIRKYNMQNSQEWYELYAILHDEYHQEDETDTEDNVHPDELSNYIIGMGYFCVHLSSGWIFANYLAIEHTLRNEHPVAIFYENIKEKINSKIKNSKAKGVVFEVAPMNFDFLVKIAESSTKVSGSDQEDEFIIQMKSFRRLNWFIKQNNVYIVLDKKGSIFPYVQPGMDDPVQEHTQELFLMIELFNTDLKNDSQELVEEILVFLYDDLFMSGSGERAKGYEENVTQVKQSVLEKINGCILGRREDLILTNSEYNCKNLFNKLRTKSIEEKMWDRLRLL